MQLHGITLSFHRQMEDASRDFFWPNAVMAVSSESYPRFIKSGFDDHDGLGIKRATAKAMHCFPHTRGCYEALFGCTPAPRPRCAVEPRKVAETTKVAFVGVMMAGSDRFAVFLVRLVINW